MASDERAAVIRMTPLKSDTLEQCARELDAVAS